MRFPETRLRSLGDPKQRACLAVMVCLMVLVMMWLQGRSLGIARRSLAANITRIDRMRTDAAHITDLQSRPQQAVDREKPNSELLTQVEAALSEANVPRELWQDSIPQPPQRNKNSDYLRISTRLMFEEITLEQIAAFGHCLLDADPTIQIVSLRIHGGSGKNAERTVAPHWNMEFVTAYLVYDPDDDTP